MNEEMYEDAKNNVITKISYNAEMQEKFKKASNNLLDGVQKIFNNKNRDLFTKNFQNFKQSLSSSN